MTLQGTFVLAVAVALATCIFCNTGVQATDASLSRFLSWFESNGGLANGVELRDYNSESDNPEQRNVGIVATADVKDLQDVITVPLDMVFCRKTALKFAGPELAALYSKVTSDETLVALMLMRERALGKRSRFAPFVDILPSAVPVPFVFTEAELSEFHDEGFVRKARNTRSRHDAEYRQLAQTGRLKTLLTTTDGDGARPTESAVTMFGSKQSYLWAQSLVGSRTLTLSGKRFLVPFADFFNYSPTGRKRAARGGEHFLKHHRLDENAETFTVLADRDCPAGEQLYEDYGDNPNDIYAQYHAFVAPDNPFDCISVTLPGLEEGRSSKLTKAHARLAKSMNVKDFSHGPVECLYSSAASSNKAMPLPARLTLYMDLRSLSDKGAKKCDDLYFRAEGTKQQRRNKAFDCVRKTAQSARGAKFSTLTFSISKRRLSEKNFRDLVDSVQKRISEHPSENEDAAALERSKNDAHRALGIAFRLSRTRLGKRIVNELHAERKRDYGASKLTADDGKDEEKELEAWDRVLEERSLESTESSEEAKVWEQKAAALNAWVLGHPRTMTKIKAKHMPGMRIGTVATDNINPEEVYLKISPDIIMDRDSALACPTLSKVWAELRKKMPRGDPYHELLLHLLHERLVKKEASSFWPYLDALPSMNLDEFHFPAFYEDDALDELKGTGVLDSIHRERAHTKRQFDGIRKHVIEKFPEAFPPELFTFDAYRWAHAVLDSRSIWWNGERHLVPLLDMINCIEGPDPSRVHSTYLEDGLATTKAGWKFSRGEQFYENYGQPNGIYFLYHGFVLSDNTHDCARVDLGAKSEDEFKRLQSARMSGRQSFCLTGRDPGSGADKKARDRYHVRGEADWRDTKSIIGAAEFFAVVNGDATASRKTKLEALRGKLQSLMNLMPGSADETVGDAFASEHVKMAIKYRATLRRELRSTIELIGKRLTESGSKDEL